MAIAAGTRLGHYEVVAPIGAGGMGEVYAARDTRLGRRVALKLLSADVTRNENRVRRFQQEARSASALNHPNIITIYEIDQIEGAHFIATEFIEGETLRQRMQRGPMTLGEVLEVAIQVATALAAAHAAAIMHRDIKPENIMLRPDGYVKVLDFGLAKLTERPNSQDPDVADPDAKTQSAVHTDPGTVMGTVSYMSPEQARGNKVDSRTDIFSLGVVMYEMVAGRVPFDGSSIGEVIASILQRRPMPLVRYTSEVNPEMERIVSKALGKQVDERYQTVKDLLIDLKRLKRQIEIEIELEHSSHGHTLLRDSGGQAPAVSRASGAKTEELTKDFRSQSSAEYILTEIKRHKKSAVFTLAALVFVAAGFWAYLSGKSKTIESLAVLPFFESSGDANAKEISEAITQRLIISFSRLPNLKVKSFITVAGYEGRVVDPMTAGRDLDVHAVLLGRVVKRDRDGNLSLVIELVNTRDSNLIWAERYDRKFADLRQVQEDILTAVSAKLGIQMNDEEKKRQEAEALYAEGRNFWEKRTSDGIRQAMDSFQQAIMIRPNYALAYAGLADCYNMLATYGAEPPASAFPKSKEAAQKAIELDRSLAEGHTALAFATYRGDWRWDDAEVMFQRAIRLNSNYAQAHQWYANYLAAVGRHPEAEQQTRACLDLDPTSLIIRSHFGFVYYFAHRYDDVIAACQKTLELDQNFFAARRYLGWAYTQKGMHAEAINQFRQAVAGSKGSMLMKAELAYALAMSANGNEKAEARLLLEELMTTAGKRYISPYSIAVIYAGLGEKDQAFEWLEKAYGERADFLVYLKADPRFDPLRSDPRLVSLQQRMNIP
jgi:eukaryotic-like serine/threonine-protein kinase